ncbi:MAG: FKBP-type peptidyl-prolyl cis-trans isomerase [Candidatus Ancillula sp.]|jgi:peptidylprolyl isomerase|nr:FKBP-type peptidyl-prolyl cis-trans isomerase [Candidatus Ancillula sp.]
MRVNVISGSRNGKLLFAGLFCILLLATSTLTSCSFSKSNTTDANAHKLKGITVQQNAEKEPTVSIEQDYKIPVEVASDKVTGVNIVDVISTGDGQELKDGVNARIDYAIYAMPGAQKQYSSWEDGGNAARSFPMYPNADDPNDLYKVLKGLKVGAVLVQAIPGQAPTDETTNAHSNQQANEQESVDKTGTHYTVMVLRVSSVVDIKKRADGKDVSDDQIDKNLPKVKLANNGAPSIEIPAGFSAPASLVVQPLKIGNGPKVKQSDTVSFAYTAWKMDGSKYESTWDTARAVTFSMNVVNESWKKGLIDATVGSQIMLIIPKSVGDTGANVDSKAIIFVIDILGIMDNF